MQETTIYLIRHAEAEGNLYRRIHGHYDTNVTENGLRQIAALEERFRDVPIDAVYSSDLTRTCRTARAVADPKGLEIRKDPRFREISLGVWEDMPFGELAQTDGAQLNNFSYNPMYWRTEGAETFQEYTDRFLDGLQSLTVVHPGQTVAVFTHGGVMSGAISRLFAEEELRHSDNTAVTKLRYDGSWHMDYAGDNSHLTPEISTLGRQNWWRREGRRTDTNLWFLPFEGEIEWYLRLSDSRIPVAPMAVMNFAMLGKDPIGFVQLDPQRGQEEGVGFIDYLGLEEKYRGQGLGVQMIGCAVSHYRKLGRHALQIYLPERFAKTEQFFLRDGFRPTGGGYYEKCILVPDGR